MISSLHNGISALKSFTEGLQVLGNNIANAGSVGYKSSRVNYSDNFYLHLNKAEAGADGARVVDGPADVGSWVDSGHHEIEGATEGAKASEVHAECRRTVHRPRGVNAVKGDAVCFGGDPVQRPKCCAGPGEFAVRGDHGHLPMSGHRLSESVQANGRDAVIVCYENSHRAIFACERCTMVVHMVFTVCSVARYHAARHLMRWSPWGD